MSRVLNELSQKKFCLEKSFPKNNIINQKGTKYGYISKNTAAVKSKVHSTTSNQLNSQHKPISLSPHMAIKMTQKISSNSIKFAGVFHHKEH